MRNFYALLAMVFILPGICLLPVDAFANVYASQIKLTNPDGSPFDGNFSDGTGLQITFTLNDTANAVDVSVIDIATGLNVADIAAGPQGAGPHSALWDGSGGVAGKMYVIKITASQPNRSTTDWTVFFDSGDINIFTRGVDVVRDETSPLFGLFYAPNTGGGAPQEGKGIAIYNPDGSPHDPFFVAKDIGNGGPVDWGGGSDAMFAGVFDDQERFYVSALNFGEVRRINTDNSVTTVVSGLTNPKGLAISGTGADLVLYICDDSKVVRAAIGDADVFAGSLETVGQFTSGFPRNIAVDDDGAIYVSFRNFNQLDSDPVSLNKYDLSGTLPVGDADGVWFLDATQTLRVADLAIDHGSDPSSAADDILYYSTRAGSESFDDGVWRVDDINFPFPTVMNLINEMDLYGNDMTANINDRAAIALDAAGNIVLMENSNEHVFLLSPPGEGMSNSFTTTSSDTATVDIATSVRRIGETLPTAYRLAPNYPNPFNPSTTINYAVASAGQTTLKIYNMMGQEVVTLVSEQQPAGEYSVVWDGRDAAGIAASSGVYLLRLQSGEFSRSRRITLVK